MKGAQVPHLGSFVSGLEIEPNPGEHTNEGKFPDAAGLLTQATEFLYAACPDYEWEIFIRKRWQPSGCHLWAVYFGDKRVWDKVAKQFIHEGGDALDSKRHLKRCRFKTLKAAWMNAGLGVQARRAQEAVWNEKRRETEVKTARFKILEAARTGSSLAYKQAEDDHGIGFWDLVEHGAMTAPDPESEEPNKLKVALFTANQVEHNAQVLRKAFVAKFGDNYAGILSCS